MDYSHKHVLHYLSTFNKTQILQYDVTLFHQSPMKLGVRVLTRPLLLSLLLSFDLTLGVVGAVIVPLLEDFDRAVCELKTGFSGSISCIPLSDFIRVNRAIVQVLWFWRFSTSRFGHRSFHVSTSVLSLARKRPEQRAIWYRPQHSVSSRGKASAP